MFLHKIMSLPKDNISSKIFFRRLFLFTTDENLVASGFIPDICRLLCRYNLQTILNTFNNDSRFIGKYMYGEIQFARLFLIGKSMHGT